MPRPTKRLRFRPHAPVNATRYGAAAHTGAALRPLSAVRWYLWAGHMVPAVHPHRGRRRGPWPLAGDCAICGWRFGRLGDFARCDGRKFRAVRGATGGAAPWTPRFWATRRPLASVVGEEFFVRARCGFAAILDVWQETAPRLWRKRPGEHRRHTGGGWPSQKKIE